MTKSCKKLSKRTIERYQSAGDYRRDLAGFLSRFDPDFSVQDLSHFVKGLFSQEIVQARKKQVVYAQVRVEAPAAVTEEKTQVMSSNNSIREITQMSLDALSFDELSKSSSAKKSEQLTKSYAVPFKKAAGDDTPPPQQTASIRFDDLKSNAAKLQTVKRNAHRKSKELRTSQFIDTSKNRPAITQQNKTPILLTVVFSLSFVFACLSYINRYHPDFKVRFCQSMEVYGVCARSWYVPANLLTINSSPAGAELTINDQIVGRTPFDYTVEKLPVQVTLSMPGRRRINQVIREMPADQKVNLQMPMAPTGFLRLTAVGVSIFIDGILVRSGKKVPVEANKDIEVRVVNPITNQTVRRTFRVREGQTIQKVIELKN